MSADFFFFLITQMETPVLCTKAAVHWRSSRQLKSFFATNHNCWDVPFLGVQHVTQATPQHSFFFFFFEGVLLITGVDVHLCA